MRADIFFFLAIFVFIFVAWVATGGPQRPISTAGPFITPVTNTGQEQEGYGGNWWDIPKTESNWWDSTWGGSSSRSSSNNSDTNSAQRELWRTQDTLEELQRETQDARLFGTPSPHKGKVSISNSVKPLESEDEDLEYITLTSSSRENIDITGWKLVSVRHKTYGFIPRGTTLYRSGSVNQTAAIVLQPGDRAIVTTGRSPVGVSFRENSCSGYLADRQDFVPELRTSCPAPLDDFERFYDGASRDYQACKDAVRRAPRCETPTDRDGASDACYRFMRSYYTYNSCITYHANDRDFWGRTWRVYLGRTRDDLWASSNDTIKLLDANGLTVDTFSY